MHIDKTDKHVDVMKNSFTSPPAVDMYVYGVQIKLYILVYVYRLTCVDLMYAVNVDCANSILYIDCMVI